MFQLLQPILLLSIAGIVIPVIIHLWNIKQGKTLKIGSISLLAQGSRQSARSFKLHDLLLLLLRCLLLVLPALLLAEPMWKKELSVEKEKGWVLLEKESLQESYGNNKTVIDSLLKAGYEFHYFNPGFKKDNFEEALKNSKDTAASSLISYWNLLTRLNEEVSASLPVYLFTGNRLNRFTGERPQLSLNLHWQTYLPADSVATWPAKAFLTPADSVHLLIGHSKPSGTFYTEENLSPGRSADADYNVEVVNGRLMVSSKDSFATNIEVDTSTTRITIFADNFNNDAGYFKAAITAIKRFSKRKLQLYITDSHSNIPANQDWVFWLSEKTFDAEAKNIFVYEKGKAENTNSWIIPGDVSATSRQAVPISKIITRNASAAGSEDIWTAGFGNSLLSREIKNSRNIFHFYSRLDPEWNQLPWSEEFPKLLFSLIFSSNDDYTSALNDKRIVEDKQIQPFAKAGAANTGKDRFTEKMDLSRFFWLAAFVIFFLERFVSFKSKRGERSA